jgi:hypothetical protein
VLHHGCIPAYQPCFSAQFREEGISRHALLGVILYQSLYLLPSLLPIIVVPEMAEIIRMIVTSFINLCPGKKSKNG